ncbi:unnamed protein product [Ixodes hexagonus]
MAPVRKKALGNAENDRPKKSKTHRYCCVKDCHNNDGTPSMRLFRFPSQPWDKERRQRWIAAVRRVNTDGSQWMPNDGSRICSEHFVNNDKSNIANHPAYCPTLFPAVYNTISVIPQDKASRFDRWHRSAASTGGLSAVVPTSALTGSSGQASSSQAAEASSSQDWQPEDKTQSSAVRLLSGMLQTPITSLIQQYFEWMTIFLEKKGAIEQGRRGLARFDSHSLSSSLRPLEEGSQTDETGIYRGQFSAYVCTLQDGNGCTQITHPDVRDTGVQVKPCVSSRQSGGDQKTGCFQGYRSVQHSPDALRDLCNVTAAVFALLLSMLPKSSERSLDTPVPDKLLLFLMKLKLGLSYFLLALLFSVHRTTASRHFRTVLATLSVAT